jgi:hypothetical protein
LKSRKLPSKSVRLASAFGPQLRREHAVVVAGDGGRVLAAGVEPGALVVEPGPRLERRILAGDVVPVVPGVIEDHVEDDAEARGMRGVDHVDEILAAAEVRVDLEEILDGVAVVRVQVPPLLEHRTDPQRGDAERLQIADLRRDPPQGASLPALAAALRPPIEAERGGSRGGEIAAVEQRATGLGTVAEPIGEQKVQHFVAPVGGRGEVAHAAGERERIERGGTGLSQDLIAKRHDSSAPTIATDCTAGGGAVITAGA